MGISDIGTTRDRREGQTMERQPGDITARRPISGVRELMTFIILLAVIVSMWWQNADLKQAILNNHDAAQVNTAKLDILLQSADPQRPYRISVDKLLAQHYRENTTIQHELDLIYTALAARPLVVPVSPPTAAVPTAKPAKK